MLETVLMEFAAVANRHDRVGVAEVEQVVHDRLLYLSGARRASGVKWCELVPCPSVDKFLTDTLGTRADGLRGFLDEHPLALLIVGMVDVAGGDL